LSTSSGHTWCARCRMSRKPGCCRWCRWKCLLLLTQLTSFGGHPSLFPSRPYAHRAYLGGGGRAGAHLHLGTGDTALAAFPHILGLLKRHGLPPACHGVCFLLLLLHVTSSHRPSSHPLLPRRASCAVWREQGGRGGVCALSARQAAAPQRGPGSTDLSECFRGRVGRFGCPLLEVAAGGQRQSAAAIGRNQLPSWMPHYPSPVVDLPAGRGAFVLGGESAACSRLRLDEKCGLDVQLASRPPVRAK
jgi:hypothetical protein